MGIGGAELVVRLYSAIGGDAGTELAKRDPMNMLFVPFGDFGYRQKPGKGQDYANGTRANWNSLGYRGPEVSRERPAGVYRIVLLGGSTTHGYGVDDEETIDAHLRRILEAKYPDRSFEVVNLALGGYDSYQLYERMKVDGLAFEPNLLIVNSGVNDVRNSRFQDLQFPDPRTLLWEADMSRMREEAKRGGPSLWVRLNHYFYLARLPSFARSRLTGTRKRAEPVELVTYADAADNFEANIRRVMTLARDAGAQIMLATPASSLLTRYEPTATSDNGYWLQDAEATQRYRDELADRLRRLARAFSTQDRPVIHVAPSIAPENFLDDCHLTGEGNRAVARAWSETLSAYLADS